MLPNGSYASRDALDPFSIRPPEGVTYQWARCSMLGEAEHANLEARLQSGWVFVDVADHPGAHIAVLRNLLEEPSAMVLMQRPTVEVQEQMTREHAANVKKLEDAKAKIAALGGSVTTIKGT